MLVAIVGIVLGLKFLGSNRSGAGPAQLPDIPLGQLSPEAAGQIQKQMDEVRRLAGSAGSAGLGEAWGRLGGILKSAGLTAQATVCLAEAQRLSPQDPRWPYLNGSIPGERTIELLTRAVELGGTNGEMPRLRLARAFLEANRLDEARSQAEGVLRDKPDCPPARLLLAQISQSRGEWQKAIEQGGPCLASPYTARAAGNLLAMAYGRVGDTNAAQRLALLVAQRPPDVSWPDPIEEEVLAWRNDPRILSDRAQAHLAAGRPEAALPLIEKLQREHPNFAETWLLLGRAQYLQKQPGAAEATIRRHLQMEQASVQGHFQLGMALLAQQKFAEATLSFREALKLKPDLGPAHFNLGFALLRLGQPQEAVEPFRQAIRYNPEKIDSYLMLAELHVRMGEMEEAARLADAAEKLDPSDRRLVTLRKKITR